MLIPGEVCAELTVETADRLRQDDYFTAFKHMDSSAQDELRGGLKRLGRKNRKEVGNLRARNKSLARALIIFARDPTGDLHAVPWARSPERSDLEYHHIIMWEFRDFASDHYKDAEVGAPVSSFPDAIGGLVVPYKDQMVFLGHHYSGLTDEYTSSIKQSQQILAENGVVLHAHLASTFLRADVPGPS